MEMEHIEKQIEELKTQVAAINKNAPENKISMIVFSGALDKALAAFMIATGSAAMGMEAVMFFTFWGTPMMRDKNKPAGSKDLMSNMFGSMLPTGVDQTKLSQMNMGGMGTAMMKSVMKKKNIASLSEMISMAGEMGVKIYVCEMSADLMGFKHEEMIDYPGLEYCGVASFLEEAANSKIQLFI